MESVNHEVYSLNYTFAFVKYFDKYAHPFTMWHVTVLRINLQSQTVVEKQQSSVINEAIH